MNRSSRCATTVFVIAGLLSSVAGCHTGTYEWHKGLPRSVDVERTASEPTRELRVRRRGDGRVELRVMDQRQVELSRRVVYQSIAVRRTAWNPATEVVEIPMGLLMLPTLLLLVPTAGINPAPEQPGVHIDKTRKAIHNITVLLNPARTGFSGSVAIDHHSDAEHFVEQVPPTQFGMAAPAAEVVVRYDIRSLDGTTLAQGKASSDDLGRVLVDGVGVGVVVVEASIDGDAVSVTLPAVGRSADAPKEPPTSDADGADAESDAGSDPNGGETDDADSERELEDGEGEPAEP